MILLSHTRLTFKVGEWHDVEGSKVRDRQSTRSGRQRHIDANRISIIATYIQLKAAEMCVVVIICTRPWYRRGDEGDGKEKQVAGTQVHLLQMSGRFSAAAYKLCIAMRVLQFLLIIYTIAVNP